MKKRSFLQSRTPQMAPLFALMAMTVCVHADIATWAGADGIWATPGNWVGPPAAVPGAADTATFSSGGYAGTGAAPINNLGTASVNSIVFDGTAQDYRLSGTINLSAGGSIIANNGNQTFASTYTETPALSGNFVPTGASINTLGSASFTNNGSGTLNLGISSGVPGSTLTFDGTGAITTVAQLAPSGNTTAVVKNGSGTLTLGNFSNTAIQGGFTINGGTVVAANAASLSNRNLTLASGTTVQMNATGAGSAFGNTAGTGVTVNGDTTFFYNVNSSQWRVGQTGGQGFLSSSNSPTVTFKTAGGTGNVQVYLNNTGFDGTWKLGDEGVLALNHVNAANGANVRMNMGDAASAGRHILQTGTILAVEGVTQGIVPVQLGQLSGTNTGAILAGRVNVGTRTTGTQYRVGGLGTSTAYAGTISDGVTTAGTALVTNGTASAGTQTNGVAGVQGTTEFVKIGAGTLTLTGTSTHTGGTVIQGGVLAVNSDAALGATYDGSLRPFSVIPGTGAYNGVTGVLPSVALSGGSPVTAASVGLFSSDSSRSNASLYVSFGTATNSTSVGSGYISVPDVVFSGGTQSTVGTGPVASVRVQGLVTLDGGTLRTDVGITSNRALVIGAGGGTISTQGLDSTFSGNVNGSGNLSLTGGGTVSLTSATNSLTGTATVGPNTTLDLAGALAGSVQVDSTGTIGGTGSVGGTLSLASGAMLDVSGGILTVAPGQLVSFGGFDFNNIIGFDVLTAAAGTYTMIDGEFALDSTNIAHFGLANALDMGGDRFAYFKEGSLDVVVIPEPAAAMLGLLGTLALLRRRR